ncbi:cation:proton antiporter [Microbulbifer sp. THAF38]|uniref:cation:proton antiporter domain-containing protein n=1 Tax=Microbulbifer sp. THAF38 TaxID=2587856 RepID=UPI00126872FB|nr:cation:proton antiporter [Microbulbifer sp. THAF38]QFT54892.1 Glutathione-regulated potassium-efflux system protein KefC [Microbulbifer sp. THAF38]
MEDIHALIPVITLLLLGVLAIILMRPLRLSPIVGYLIAGLAVGPHALDLIPESNTTHLLAELGVVFLLFDIGLHFSLSNIWDARRDIFILGPLQILLCGAAFAGIALALGVSPAYAGVIGGALALSSTAVVVQSLTERGQQDCPVGRTGTAVLIFQDICAIFLLVMASSLEGGSSPSSHNALTAEILSAIAKSVVAFVAAALLGRYAIRPLFGLLSKTRNEEVFTAMALLVVLATAAGTGAVGLSLTLGAFLGGMMISETPYRHVIQTEAKPFRNLLLAFFFITVGMSLDWRILLDQWAKIILFILILMAVKVFLVALAARACGWSLPGSLQLGSLLAQGSEFVFVIIAMPLARESLGEQAVGIVITGVAASLALTPTLSNLGNRLGKYLWRRSSSKTPSHESKPVTSTAPVVIFGMDEVGRLVADALEAQKIDYDAIEMDYDRFLKASADGYPVAFGDLADIRMMETFQYAERAAIVITIVRYELSKALKPVVSARYPNLKRFVSVDGDSDLERFKSLGMYPVVNRSIPRGLDLAAAVLHSQGVDDKKIKTWIERRQQRDLDSHDIASNTKGRSQAR